ncbi:MAG: hypothetical protein ACI8ZB_003650 [Desulforhopalus sp.]|jgi:hypothetical protein
MKTKVIGLKKQVVTPVFSLVLKWLFSPKVGGKVMGGLEA